MSFSPAFLGSKSKVVSAILASLRDHPEQWTIDRYVALHTSGVYVWIANSYYGLAVGMEDARGIARTEYFGGVNVWFPSLVPWRRKLYRACAALYRERNKMTENAIVESLA